MKRLIFVCGYDDFYFGLANLTAHTIRESGYEDDLVIFTIEEKTSPYATCLNLAAHPEAHLIRLQQGAFFHKNLCTGFGFAEYAHPFDYFIIKTLPGTIVDRSRYDFILYMDSDILVHPGQSLDEIFQYEVPVSDYNDRDALRDVKGLRKHLTRAERDLARRLRGFGGGAFGVPRRHYGFFERYREYYLRYLPEIPHDQPVLSFVKVRHHEEFPFQQWPNRKFFRHYWGGKKQMMIQAYTSRFGASALRKFFPNLALINASLPASA
jgi:hypothetical protein